MTTDYYGLLGVAPDAPRDEIKAAYRQAVEGAGQGQKAELNRAWNVLSDPTQRDRYDERLAAASADLDPGEGEAEEGSGTELPPLPPVPKGITGARGALFGKGATAAKASPGDGTPSKGATAPRPRPEPTLVLPDGLEFAPTRARNLSLAFDVAILILIVIVCQQFLPKLVDSSYDKNTSRYNHQIDLIDKAQKREDKANSRADTAKAAATKAKRQNDAVEAQAQQAKQQAAKNAAHDAAKAKDAAQKRADSIQKNDLAGAIQISTAIAFVLALLYTVPLSAFTGQTLGKRLRKIEVVRTDGSPVGWTGSLVHYGFPIAVSLLLGGFLGPILGVVGLGVVLWYLRDRNHQGVHDKLARTVVVEVPGA